MKKLTTLCTALCLFMTAANAVDASKPMLINETEPKPVQETQIKNPDCNKDKMKNNRVAAFENKLGLTEVQKLKTRELRKQSFETLRPVLEEIKTKKQEAEMIRRSRMAVQMQEEKLAVIDKELAVLEKKAHDIRNKNMKDFEAILTKEQKKTLKKMKKEGRKRFEAKHKPTCKKPCQQKI